MKTSSHPLSTIIFVLSFLLTSACAYSQGTDYFEEKKPLNNYEIQFSFGKRFQQTSNITHPEGQLKFNHQVISDVTSSLQLTKRAPNKFGWQAGVSFQGEPFMVSVTYDSNQPAVDILDLRIFYGTVYGGLNYTYRFKHHFELINSINLGLCHGSRDGTLRGYNNDALYYKGTFDNKTINQYLEANFVFRKMLPFYSIGISTGIQYLFHSPFVQQIQWVETVDTNFTLTARKFSIPFSVVLSRNLCSKKSTLYTHGGYWD